MIIDKIIDGKELTIMVEGRLDTMTAPALDYISSAGLRVILSAQKLMNKQGEMIVNNVNETGSEIFEITGFCDVLTIE